MSLKILFLDIETAPNTAYIWELRTRYISPDRLIETRKTLCWAAKWLGDDEMMYSSIHKTSPRRMINRVHRLLEEADAVVHYNGSKFDIPVLNKDFLMLGITPPAPYKQIDLLKVARTQFKFPSNKMDYIAKALGIEGKAPHRGMEMWKECLEGRVEAWAEMEAYNKQDVLILEQLYQRMLPWIKKHPNYGLYEPGLVCPNCGSGHYQRRGFTYTDGYKYARYQCQAEGCGKWFRGNKTETKRDEERFVGI